MLLILFTLLSARQSYADLKIVMDFSQPSIESLDLTPEQKGKIAAALAPAYVGEDASPDANGGLQECADFASWSAIKGHFSNSDDDEILVAFSSARCPAVHAGRHGNVALFDSSYQLISYSNDVEADAFAKVTDMDGDGLSEVITTLTDGNQGEFSADAETLTFKNGWVESLDYISGEVWRENCGGDPQGGSEYVAIFAQDEGTKALNQYNFVRRCSGGDWHSYSIGPLKVN